MKNLLTLSVGLFLLAPVFCQNQISPTSEINDVTVFLSGAQVYRTASIDVKAGENVITLGGLTQHLDGNSVQVEGSGAYLIKSVKHQLNYLEDASLAPSIQQKVDSIEDLQFTLSMRAALENVYNEEKNMIVANRSVKGNDAVLLAEDIEEVADLFRKRLQDIEYKLLELRQEKKDIQKDISQIQNHLNQLNANRNKVNSEILVTVIANKASKAKIDLSYIIRQAGWSPTYDLRAEDTKGPIELRYKANVYQTSGNDWNGVKLTLSTGNPTVGGQAPNMGPWWLNVYEPQIVSYGSKGYNKQRAKAYGAPTSDEYVGEADLATTFSYDETASGIANFVTVSSSINTEFKIAIPYDIPSDGQPYEVETQRITLNAGYEHKAIPKLDEDAFLIANVTDWQEHNLLAGESQIYFQGTFVGKAWIDPAIAEDTLQLSLGRDKGVIVNREKITEMCKTVKVGGKKRTEKGYRITVQNNKQQAITLNLLDQLPLTKDSDVEVEILDISGAKHDLETGELSWDVNLLPGAKAEYVIKYSVKYPKKKVVGNL